jgi:hypothetical protein
MSKPLPDGSMRAQPWHTAGPWPSFWNDASEDQTVDFKILACIKGV